jgi:hypothetical protein
MLNKPAIVAWFRAALEQQLDALKRSQQDAASSMRVDGSHRPANRGERGAVTSAGYLTQGIEARITEVGSALELLERAGDGPREKAVTGAIVTVERASGDTARFWIFPGVSGLVYGEPPDGDGPITGVSPESPVGQGLWACEEDDEAELPDGPAIVIAVD